MFFTLSLGCCLYQFQTFCSSIAQKYLLNGSDQKLLLLPVSNSLVMPTNGPLLLTQTPASNSLVVNNTKDKMIVNENQSIGTALVLEPNNSITNIPSSAPSSDGKYQTALMVTAPTIVSDSKNTFQPLFSSSTSTSAMLTTTSVPARLVAPTSMTAQPTTINPMQHGMILKTSSETSKQGVILKQTPMNHITQLQQQIRPRRYFLSRPRTSSTWASYLQNTAPAFKIITGPSGQTTFRPNFTTGTAVFKGTTKPPTPKPLVAKKNNVTQIEVLESSNSFVDRKIITKALKPPKQLPAPLMFKAENQNHVNDEDPEVAAITKDIAGIKRKPSQPLLLYSDENINRSSPELWPEAGKFILKTSKLL